MKKQQRKKRGPNKSRYVMGVKVFKDLPRPAKPGTPAYWKEIFDQMKPGEAIKVARVQMAKIPARLKKLTANEGHKVIIWK